MHIYYVAGVPYSDELYHYGILGQKWGIRRFQNSDGTLTEAGKARYNSNKQDNAFVRGVKKIKDHQVDKFKNKHPWMMSDEELNTKTQRINRERAYLQAVADTKKLSQGRRVFANIIERGANTIGDKLFNKIATNITTDEIEKENTKLRRLLDNRDLKKKLDSNGDKGTIAKLTDIMNNPSNYSNSEIKDAAETLGKLSSGRKLVSGFGFESSNTSVSNSSGAGNRMVYTNYNYGSKKSVDNYVKAVESSEKWKQYNKEKEQRLKLYGPGGTAYR